MTGCPRPSRRREPVKQFARLPSADVDDGPPFLSAADTTPARAQRLRMESISGLNPLSVVRNPRAAFFQARFNSSTLGAVSSGLMVIPFLELQGGQVIRELFSVDGAPGISNRPRSVERKRA